MDAKCKFCSAVMTDLEVGLHVDLCSRCKLINHIEPVAGSKFDQGKRRYSLVPPKSMEQFVDVLTFGAEKYGDHNWKQVPNLQNRYYDALQRHVASFRNDETYDEESGKHHLAHAMCCLAFMMQADIDGELL